MRSHQFRLLYAVQTRTRALSALSHCFLPEAVGGQRALQRPWHISKTLETVAQALPTMGKLGELTSGAVKAAAKACLQASGGTGTGADSGAGTAAKAPKSASVDEETQTPGPAKQGEVLQGFLMESFEQASYDDGRAEELQRMADYIKEKVASGQPIKLNYICTHNSRRSHMGAVMAAASAVYFGVPNVVTFSGGTEGTALAPPAVVAMERAGVGVTKLDESSPSNPVYVMEVGAPETMECYSKRFDEPPNPTSGFAAVMVCGSADRGCPVVFGADDRFVLTYHDPKSSDSSGAEAQMKAYDLALRTIAGEAMTVFSRVAS